MSTVEETAPSGWLCGGMAQPERAAQALLACNCRTAVYGLTLTEGEAAELARTQARALQTAGRIELGGGVLDRLALAFSDSPYLSQQNYADMLHGLTEMFYQFKNDCGDRISDDRLICFLRRAFDGPCAGSLELLAGSELPRLARELNARCAGPDFAWGKPYDDET